MDEQRLLDVLAQLITETAEDRNDLRAALRAAVALALVGVVPAKATIVRWNELIKKAEDRQ